MLAGDIGAGKSSILLALEFALFGLERGSAEGLVRKGEKKANVALTFSLGQKTYTIFRQLHRGPQRISQESGWLEVDGVRKEGTPVELTTWIVELLQYPSESVAKKNLLFRYTVYCPQEAMKKILLDKKEDRLDTLRKVFGIDKYKQITQNTSIYQRKLREKLRFAQGQISRLDDKKQMHAQRKEQVTQLFVQETESAAKHKALAAQLAALQETLQKQEAAAKVRQEKVHALQLAQTKLDTLVLQKKREQERLEAITTTLADLQEKYDAMSPDQHHINVLTHSCKELEEKAAQLQEEQQSFQAQKQAHELQMQHKEKEAQKVLDLDSCPMCQQDVAHDHKSQIRSRLESQKMQAHTSIVVLQKKVEHFAAERHKLLEQLSVKKESLQGLEKRQLEVAYLKKDIERHTSEKAQLAASTSKKEIGQVNVQIMTLQKELEELPKINLDQQKQEERELAGKEKQLSVHVAQIRAQKEQQEKEIVSLAKEIEELQAQQAVAQKMQTFHDYLADFFSPLMTTMERHVMRSVHSQFDELFQEWFALLLDDEHFSIRLDDQFTPVITQNGYDIELEDLSGGEKTAVSLAYRLALNRVINDLVSTIRTKDLLILDEPTEGFSTEQLDKMRDVLEQLGLTQVLIVSHENKIESVVDSCLRIIKTEHESTVHYE